MNITNAMTQAWGNSMSANFARGGRNAALDGAFSGQLAAGESQGNRQAAADGQSPVKSYTLYMRTDDMLYSGGNGTGLSFYLKYAENSTEGEPIMTAKGVDENGNEFEKTIYVNKIDPNNATLVEMRALEAYLDAGSAKWASSLPPDVSGFMGLDDKVNFFDELSKTIKNLTLARQGQMANHFSDSMREYYAFFNSRRPPGL